MRFALIVLCTLTIALQAADKVWIKVSPSIMFEPGWVHVRVHADKDEKNRRLNWWCDNGEFYSSSDIQLDGDNAPQTFQAELKGLPSGSYECGVTVVQNDSTTIRNRTQFRVISRNDIDPQ